MRSLSPKRPVMTAISSVATVAMESSPGLCMISSLHAGRQAMTRFKGRVGSASPLAEANPILFP
jgi:hypothetical protein